MMDQPQYQCYSCKHYADNSSCGNCITKAHQILQSIRSDVPLDPDVLESEATQNQIKYRCKIVVQDPSEFDKVDPMNCPYYFSSAFRLS